jgi:hypothetical protein
VSPSKKARGAVVTSRAKEYRQLARDCHFLARSLTSGEKPASARAHVGFVRANLAEYDIAEVIPRAAGP